jgi:hypothetical protein
LLPFVALLAIGAGGAAAIAITTEPHTSPLQHQVSSMRTQLAAAQQQLATLQRADASGSEVARLSKSVAGLSRTVGGLQSTVVPLKSKVETLSICVPELQQELAGTSVQVRGKKAALLSPVSVSAGCAAMLSGG